MYASRIEGEITQIWGGGDLALSVTQPSDKKKKNSPLVLECAHVDLLKQMFTISGDVLVLNNVFEFFLTSEQQVQ